MFNYPALFAREGKYIVPRLTLAGQNMLACNFVVYRLYDGITMRMKGKRWYWLDNGQWIAVKPRFFDKNRNIHFDYRQELEEALKHNQLNWPNILKHNWFPGDYELIQSNILSPFPVHRLVAHDNFEQISSMNTIDWEEQPVDILYETLKNNLIYMGIDGLLLRALTRWESFEPQYTYVQLKKADFDYAL